LKRLNEGEEDPHGQEIRIFGQFSSRIDIFQ
jgi:hypothetical protein